MKNIKTILLAASLALFNVACESDATLDETRVADTSAPTVSLQNVTLNKYTATFEVSLDAVGTPAAREYGVLVSTEAQPDWNNSIVIASDMTENQSTLVENLSPGTTYYACAYALTANQLVTSEVKSFTTESHYLGTFLGKHTLNGYNWHMEAEIPMAVEIVADPENEKVAYLKGLTSFAGVTLDLEPVKMIFDLENGTVTIPAGQEIDEKKYGLYTYCSLSPDGSQYVFDDIVGSIDGNTLSFDALFALIVEGGNAGLPHFGYLDLTIK